MANIPTTTTTSTSHRRQKRMGPAPFASFEDLSDETDTTTSPTSRLPGINEDVTPTTSTTMTTTTLTPSAPRIDISRASSSSHHEDSRDSTPERELFQGGNEQCKLGLAFKEEGALELRSSTEELDFQDPSELKQHRTSVTTVVMAATSCELPLLTHHRKDSQGSEYGGLLSISGRTSRLSSIGSQGSRVSGQSRLSVTSEMSRSPSPHKMLLETSFCGSKHDQSTDPKSSANSSQTKTIETTELLERVLLSRKHDPTEAILAEGISIECRRKLKPADSLVQLSPVLQHEEIERSPVPPEKPARKSRTPKITATNVTITVDKPVEDVIENDTRCIGLKPGDLVVAESGIEYTFIPLKGPLPQKIPTTTTTSGGSSNKGASSPRIIKRTGEPQYIRIKLKPDHMYPGDLSASQPPLEVAESTIKPVTLELNGSASHNRSPRSSPSPSVSRKSSFASLFRAKEYATSPESPTTVRIPTAVKCKKTATASSPPRSRSKSSDREHRTSETAKNNKSVFALFKTKKSHSKSKQSLNAGDQSPNKQTTTSLHSLEFTFDRPTTTTTTTVTKKRYEIPLDADTIIIPLHSPGNEPPPLPLYAETPTTEEQKLPETKMAVALDDYSPSNKELTIIEKSAKTSNRQSSTSSENVVFTTNLGSDNEIFTTKLPKKRNTDKSPIERGRQRERPPPLPVVVTSVTSTVTTMTSSSPVVQMRSPCTSVNAKITEIITEKGMTSAKVSKTTSPVPRKAEKLIISGDQENATPTAGDADEDSSESESDFAAAKPLELMLKKQPPPQPQTEESENEVERKGLVLQTDSFDDELPYVPTTLPLERSVAMPIVPVKQRATFEMKTCPIERPRSTTPINPNCLEEYVEDTSTERATLSEKLRICLPREDSLPGTATTIATLDNRIKEREKGAKKWTDFVPQHHHHHHHHHHQQIEEEQAPPLPPRGFPKDWINFEDIPERRKPPKRIQTIPSRGALLPPTTPSTANIDDGNVIYSYVNPEDCKCECHESTTGKSGTPTTPKTPGGTKIPAEGAGDDEQPLLLLLERRSDDSSPDSQAGAAATVAPPIKKKTKPTNAFPKVATTKPS